MDRPKKVSDTPISQSPEIEVQEERTDTTELVPGTIIDGRYKVISVLGRGGYGAVYKVEQVMLNKLWALKVLHRIVPSEAVVRRFQNEAKLASSLDHPNLVQAVDFGLLNGDRPFILMELVEGESLAQHLRKHGKLSLQSALDIFIPLCFAIDYAHQRGVIHRDIKPGNIILVPCKTNPELFEPKIVDFGIAKVEFENLSQSLTKTGEIFGTPLYMSPEQGIGKRVDNRSDIYSMGCMLFEALTGLPPFSGSNALQTIMQHGTDPPPSLKEASLGETFPSAIEQIVAKTLEKEPSSRYQNCADLAQHLLLLQQGYDERIHWSKHDLHERGGRAPIGPLQTAAVALAFFIVGGAVTFLLMKHHATPPQVPTELSKKAVDSDMDTTELEDSSGEGPYIRSDAKTGERLCYFPTKTIGFISIAKDAGSHFVKTNQEPAAQSTHKLPKDGCLIFTTTYRDILEHPSVLAHFSEDDLCGFELYDNGEFSPIRTGTLAAVYNYPNDFMTYLSHFKSLELLDISHSNISARGLRYAHIEELPRLKHLKLVQTAIDGNDLSRFKILKQLHELAIGRTRNASAVLAALRGSKNLEGLAAATDGLENQDLLNVSTMPTLNSLYVKGNPKINNQGLAHLVKLGKLSDLDVSGCNITPDALETVARMRSLKHIDLRGSKWEEDDKRVWSNRLKPCFVDFSPKPDD